MRKMIHIGGRYLLLLGMGALFFLPVYWMISTSLEGPGSAFVHYGEAMTFEHGKTEMLAELNAARGPLAKAAVMLRTPFARQLGNTLFVAVLGVIGTVLSCSLAAYAFARLRWPGRDAFFFLSVITMMVPFAVKLVPLYGLFRGMGWIGKLDPLWAPWFFGSGFSIFLLRQFFKGIPEDISEAARIDGCNEFTIYWRIILPLAKPALATAAVFHFLFVWNDFFSPLVFLTDPKTFTLALGLHQFQSTHGGAEWPLMMAASTLMTVPVVLLFFFSQRFFVRGMTMSGIKG